MVLGSEKKQGKSGLRAILTKPRELGFFRQDEDTELDVQNLEYGYFSIKLKLPDWSIGKGKQKCTGRTIRKGDNSTISGRFGGHPRTMWLKIVECKLLGR